MVYCYRCMSPSAEDYGICPFCGKKMNVGAPLHHLLPGTVLNGKFLVGTSLGEGGFGITYIGRDLTLDHKVAIKEYFPTGYANRSNTASSTVTCGTEGERLEFFQKGKERFLSEARTLARFEGERGIVNVRDFFEANDTAYIVMEYLEGVTLKEYLKEHGPLSVRDTLNLFKPVMDSLSRIHKNDLIHRDISPDNIMLVNGEPKLLDFGAARNISAAGSKSLSVVLKPGYAPEEQYRSKGEQGPWTDVYALCATIYKCITGVTPDDATQRLYKDELRRPSSMGVQIDERTENVLLKGMSVLYNDRYESIDALLAALSGNYVINQHNPPVEPSASNNNGSKKFKPVIGLLIGIAAIALIVVCTVFFILPKNNDDTATEDDSASKFSELEKDIFDTSSVTAEPDAPDNNVSDIDDPDEGASDTGVNDPDPEITDTDTGYPDKNTIVTVPEEPDTDITGTVQENPDSDITGTVQKDPDSDITGTDTGNGKDNINEPEIEENKPVILNELNNVSLSSPKDKRSYLFTLDKDGVIWLSCNHEEIDDESYYWDFSFFDDYNNPITELKCRGNATEDKGHRKIGLPKGTYHVILSSADQFSDMYISWGINYDNQDEWEKEFNNSKDTANKVYVNTLVNGSVMNEQDIDWYYFDINKAGKVVLEFGNLKTGKANNYWSATLYDEFGSQMINADFHGDTSDFERSATLNVKPGRHYLSVKAGEAYSSHQYKFSLSFNELEVYNAKSMISNVTASSTYEETGYDHKPANILDEKTDNENKNLCWCEGIGSKTGQKPGDELGRGEYIEIRFKEKVLISEIDIFNGYFKSEAHYNNNGKLTKGEIIYSGGSRLIDFKSLKWKDVKDKNYTDAFDFSADPIETDFIRIVIKDAVKGEKHADTCISYVKILALK